MKLPLVAVLSVCATPALASGGLSCAAKTTQASLEIQSGVTHGMGSPLFNFRGSAQIAAKSVAADLRKIAFGQGNVAQYWLDARELRLVVYREREGSQPHGYVEVTILAKAAGDEGKYKGTFALTAYDTAGDRERTHKAGGRVSCFVE